MIYFTSRDCSIGEAFHLFNPRYGGARLRVRATTIARRFLTFCCRDRRCSTFTTSALAAIRLTGRAIRVILPRKSAATQTLVDICGAGH
jgi:hypothetical protein